MRQNTNKHHIDFLLKLECTKNGYYRTIIPQISEELIYKCALDKRKKKQDYAVCVFNIAEQKDKSLGC